MKQILRQEYYIIFCSIEAGLDVITDNSNCIVVSLHQNIR